MKRLIGSLLLVFILSLGGAIKVYGHGEEEAPFDAEINVKQSIITIVQPQPNIGVIEMKLQEIIDNKEEAGAVDIIKVEEARKQINQGKYEEAKLLLFESIGEDMEGEDILLGSPLVDYEKDLAIDKAGYLLLASAIFFVGIGGLILKQTVGG